MNRLYIVLINYNNSIDTIECLESLLKNNDNNFQIFVVDNSQTENSFVELINWAKISCLRIDDNEGESIYSINTKPINYATYNEENLVFAKGINEEIVFIKANKNNGFSAGNNIALKYINENGDKDSIIWLLNNDTIINPTTINNILVEIISLKEKINKRIDIMGTPLIEYGNKNSIQALGGSYNKNSGLTIHIGENINISSGTSNILENRRAEIEYPIGASILFFKEFLDEVGLLCEDYFLFYEELDLVFRSKSKGGKLFILNIFEVFHKQGESTKTKSKERKSEFIDLISINSRLLFAKKHNKANIRRICLHILFFSLGKRILNLQFKRIPKIINLVYKYAV